MARNISYEPCTLVYTLLNEDSLPYDDFYLIVRSLHSFMVESITPNRDMKQVHVRLGYQASVQNAICKLGKLSNVIGLSKLSNFIKENEFSRLEQLRRRYGLLADDTASIAQPPPAKRGRRPRAVFGRRPAPYTTTKPTEPIIEEEDSQRFTPTYEEDENSQFFIADNTGNE